MPPQMASHTPTAEPPAGQSVPPRAAAACAPAAHGVGELCAYSPAGRPLQNIASLMLGRRLPVRVEAATGMGEKSVDSVPYLILYSTCKPADRGLHGATGVPGTSATAYINGGAAACPQVCPLRLPTPGGAGGAHRRRRQREPFTLPLRPYPSPMLGCARTMRVCARGGLPERATVFQ